MGQRVLLKTAERKVLRQIFKNTASEHRANAAGDGKLG